jgi:molybdenum cofactor cytidylyltransferase
MNSPKALLDWKGKPLILHQLAVLSNFGQIIVVTGFEAEKIRPYLFYPVIEALNENYLSGRTSSLKCGFSRLKPCSNVLVCGVDQPMDFGLPEKLLEALGNHSYSFPVFEEKKGHPLLFNGRLLSDLLEIEEESEGLRAIAKKYSAEAIAIPWASPSVLADLNTPADLANWIK